MGLNLTLPPSLRLRYLWPIADRVEWARRNQQEPPPTQTRREFRGGALTLQSCDAPEVIISGPSETGKTIASLTRLDRLMWQYAGAQAVIVRKTYKSTVSSVVQTFREKILGKQTPVTAYGGERPDWFDYPNGSRVWVGGMDNPDKVLSSERDIVYVNQAEELSLSDWEYLTTRATGRAGHMPFAQVMGDCNPSGASHWIKQRASLLLLESRHEDNPSLFDAQGKETRQGGLTLAVLDRLSGVRRERLRLGRWSNVEGAVYNFDAALHIVARFPIPQHWRRIRAIDFGYSNPFVCLWLALDDDGRLFVYRQLYMSQRTVRAHAQQINSWSAGERYEATVADHDAEDRATLAEHGIETIAASKAISRGLQAVELRLAQAGDGKPRLFVMRDSLIERDERLVEMRAPVSLEQEFDVYMWPKGADGKALKETPVDKDNHGVDALRYGVMYIDHMESNELTIGANPLAGYRG